MRSSRRRRLLLLLPTTTYRTGAFVEAARRLDVDLTVGSEQDSAFLDTEPAGLVTVDFRHPDRAVEQIRAVAARHPLDAVVGVDDDTTVVAALASHALGLPHNPRRAVEAARDKGKQRAALRSHGVPVPDFAVHRMSEDVAGLASGAAYPCVLKPLTLSASRGVIRANNAKEFSAAHRRLAGILAAPDVVERRVAGAGGDEFLIESFVPGPEFALEGLVVNGQLQVLALFDKPDPLEGPFFEETIYVTPSRHSLAVEQALIECATGAVAALGLHRGPVHAELRYNDRGPWLIELAARPIGGKCGQVLRFGPDGGITLEELLLSQALEMGEPVPDRERCAAGVMMVPIPGAGVLRDVEGVSEARSVSGVTDIIITAHRGQRLVPLPEESRYLGFIFARGDNADVVERALRRAHGKLNVVLE